MCEFRVTVRSEVRASGVPPEAHPSVLWTVFGVFLDIGSCCFEYILDFHFDLFTCTFVIDGRVAFDTLAIQGDFPELD